MGEERAGMVEPENRIIGGFFNIQQDGLKEFE